MNTSTCESGNRDIRIRKTLKAPVNRVWDAWTQPEHITASWGPDGFSTTIQKMDFQEGGEWKLTLHGPNGTNYPNRSVYQEIIPDKKIVYEHFHPHFITTVLFEAKGEETLLYWTMEFETAKMKNTIIIAHKADQGQRQNVDRLEKYLSKTNTL